MKTLIRDLYNNKKLIWTLAINDFKTKYAGSALGITWAFVQPIITILIYWFVFEVGLKSASPVEDVPFVLWMTAGIIPWFLFADGIGNATNSLIEYSYLVKKVLFKISILPLVKVISAFFVHLVFVIFTIGIYIWQGQQISIHIVQIAYYSFCTFVLALGISYLTAAIVLFFRDLGQIVGIFLQVGIWLTPIMWSYTMIASESQWLLKINPMYYIVQGYRDSFINGIWFWEHWDQTLYFWGISVLVFAVGAIVFKKLKPHFADVL